MLSNEELNKFIGRKFNHLIIVKRLKDHISAVDGKIEPMWMCECDCKPSNRNTKIVKHSNLINGIVTCCDICKKKSVIDIIGKKFGKLTVLKRSDDYICSGGRKEAQYLCRCDCGNMKIVRGSSLRKGHTTSCGCAIIEAATKHGLRNTRIYDEYQKMKQRCYNPNNTNYKYYGGKGIKVCDEWLDSEEGLVKFYFWAITHGYRDNLTIDRINSNGDYTPENCRWTNHTIQANNKGNNVYLTLNGVSHTAATWSEITGISVYNIYNRKKNLKWNDEKTLTTPENKYIKILNHSDGRSMTVTEWAIESGYNRDLIYDRVFRQGWSVDRAVSEPIKNSPINITYNGNTFSCNKWEKILGYGRGTISHRISDGMEPEKAITSIPKGGFINAIYFIDEDTGEPIPQDQVE